MVATVDVARIAFSLLAIVLFGSEVWVCSQLLYGKPMYVMECVTCLGLGFCLFVIWAL